MNNSDQHFPKQLPLSLSILAPSIHPSLCETRQCLSCKSLCHVHGACGFHWGAAWMCSHVLADRVYCQKRGMNGRRGGEVGSREMWRAQEVSKVWSEGDMDLVERLRAGGVRHGWSYRDEKRQRSRRQDEGLQWRCKMLGERKLAWSKTLTQGFVFQCVCIQQMRRWAERASKVTVEREKIKGVEGIITQGVCKDKGHRKIRWEMRLWQLPRNNDCGTPGVFFRCDEERE